MPSVHYYKCTKRYEKYKPTSLRAFCYLKIPTMAGFKSISILILVTIFMMSSDSNSLNDHEPSSTSFSYSSPANPGPSRVTYPSKPISSPPKKQPRLSKGIRAAYWPSWSQLPASSIDASSFTHIYYAFLLPEPLTFKLNVTPMDQAKLTELTSSFRSKKIPVKTLLSIGGGGSDPDVFSRMARNKQSRAVFIDSTVEIARKYGFDGVDLDWEFPANETDMANLALLYKQWWEALHHDAQASGKPRLLLTSAVYYASEFTVYGGPRSYPGEAIDRYLDWASPMCFDYHGSWENFTGVHAALFDPDSNISTSYGIKSWIRAGVRPNKLVMGLPLYGRTWKLKAPNDNGIGAAAVGIGPGNEGTLTYNQIVDFNMENKAAVKFDATRVAYYSYAGDSWIGYDDVMSVKLKVQFARFHRLAGYFFWAIGQDKDWTISKQASKAWGGR